MKMTYRTITVNDREYQYVIGATYIKIKNVGLFKTKDHLTFFDDTPQCSCGPEYNCFAGQGPTGYAVTPAKIKNLILGILTKT